MKHTVSSAADKPGMTLDQLEAAVQRARRSGATGNELVRARLYGRGGPLRSVSVELDEPLLTDAGVLAESAGDRGRSDPADPAESSGRSSKRK